VKARRLRAKLLALNLRRVRVTLREDRPPYRLLANVEASDPTEGLCLALGLSSLQFLRLDDEQHLCVAALRGMELRLLVKDRHAEVLEAA
jgi:hypothetical protein